MKKIVLNLSDSIFEKLRLESIVEEKNIQDIIIDRLFLKPFDKDVEESFDEWIDQEVEKIMKD